jgi:hypothetical protein
MANTPLTNVRFMLSAEPFFLRARPSLYCGGGYLRFANLVPTTLKFSFNKITHNDTKDTRIKAIFRAIFHTLETESSSVTLL